MDAISSTPTLRQGVSSEHSNTNLPASRRPLSAIQHNIILPKVNYHKHLDLWNFNFPILLENPSIALQASDLNIRRLESGFKNVPTSFIRLHTYSSYQPKVNHPAGLTRFGLLDLAATKLPQKRVSDHPYENNSAGPIKSDPGFIEAKPRWVDPTSKLVSQNNPQRTTQFHDDNLQGKFRCSGLLTSKACVPTQVNNSEAELSEHCDAVPTSSLQCFGNGDSSQANLNYEQMTTEKYPEDVSPTKDEDGTESYAQRAVVVPSTENDHRETVKTIQGRVTFLDDRSGTHQNTPKFCSGAKIYSADNVESKPICKPNKSSSNEPISSVHYWADDECMQSDGLSTTSWSPWTSQPSPPSSMLDDPKAEVDLTSHSRLLVPQEPFYVALLDHHTSDLPIKSQRASTSCRSTPSCLLEDDEATLTHNISSFHQQPSQTLSTNPQPLNRTLSTVSSRRKTQANLSSLCRRSSRPIEIPETQQDPPEIPSRKQHSMQPDALPWPIIQSLFIG